MTAEIAVMNQEAIALAADSAVSGPKIFTSANKIFSLSKHHPVAVMIYDSAQFLDLPWETIIKTYRRELGTTQFPTLREHAAHFLGYFADRNPLFPPEAQRRANELLFSQFFRVVLLHIDQRLEERTQGGEELTEDNIRDEASRVIGEVHKAWHSFDVSPSIPRDHPGRVKHEYRTEISAAIAYGFESLPLSDPAKEQLHEVAAALVSVNAPNPLSPYHSGVVIAGFGSEEFFPSLYEFELETIACGRLKYVQRGDAAVSRENRAVVRAFAQSEQVATFMEGIDSAVTEAAVDFWTAQLPQLVRDVGEHVGMTKAERAKLSTAMTARCGELVESFVDDLAELKQARYVGPIIRVVAMMPKDELAAMAESLVNLTSFKRKVTEEAETVGGPIDVAVISKGDGLVWIKRKHYFSPELNQQFLANYNREVT